MMAEITSPQTTGGTWAAVTGLTVIIFTQLGKWISDARKDKLSFEAEKQKLLVLQEIARSNSNIREGQIEQNGKLSTAVQVNKAYHEELIRTLATTCKVKIK